MTRRRAVLTAISFLMALNCADNAHAVEFPTAKQYTNSMGMKFVRIEPGSFQMGLDSDVLPQGAATYFYPGHYKSLELAPAAGWEGFR